MKATYKNTRNKEIFFNEFWSIEELLDLIDANNNVFKVDFSDENTQNLFVEVYENCSFLATGYEYDRICLDSDYLKLHAACMLHTFMYQIKKEEA